MNIGFFTDTYFPQISGVSTSISILKKELEARGHRVIIFTTSDPKAHKDETIVRLPSLPFISFSDRRVAYRGFDKCLKIARRMDLDIIHTHTEFSLGLAGQYVASRLHIPVVHTYHTMYERYTHYIADGLIIGPSEVKVLTRQFCSLAGGIIVPSRLTYDTLLEYGVKTPMKVIPTGIPIDYCDHLNNQSLREDLGITDQDIVFLSLSRLSKEKSIDQVIVAFKDIIKALPQAKLVIVGGGPERENLEKLAQEIPDDRVKFVGEVDHEEVDKYYQLGDVYINASDSETQGLTYIESLVNHVPVIAKKNDYLETIFEGDSHFGCLYQEENELVAVAVQYAQDVKNKVIPPINNNQLFSISSEKFGQSVEDFYREILADPQNYKHSMYNRIQQSMKDFVRELVLGSEENHD